MFSVLAANTRNICGMYDGIKKAIGPVQRMTSSIKSSTGEMLTDNNEQMERWVEHENIYFCQNTVSQNVIDSLECLQNMDELDSGSDDELYPLRNSTLPLIT